MPDVPAYMATPKSCGANPTPIAFAEVYLALQNGTVDAQENPLTTIEAKKFYEVQKAIMMTSHIVDGLTTESRRTCGTSSPTRKSRFSRKLRERGRGPGDGEDQEARGGARRRVQEEGTADRSGRPQELRRRGARELRRSSRWASRSRTTTRSSPSNRRERSGQSQDPRRAAARTAERRRTTGTSEDA